MKNFEFKIWKIPFILFLMMFTWQSANAQGMKVEGVVLDGNGETVIGASVVLKENASVGTITDIDGKFQLNVPNNNSVLVISYEIGRASCRERV